VWTKQRDRAAQLCADGRLTDTRIAAQVGISTRTLERWRTQPQFQEQVAAFIQAAEAKARECAIARKMARVAALQERWQALQQIRQERGQALADQGIPGGSTGDLVRSVKQIGSGPTAQVVTEYELDAALLRELRAHEEQAAKELGQWADQRPEEAASAPVALAQVVISSREDAKSYMERLNAQPGALVGVVSRAAPAPPVPPSLAEALDLAQAGSGEAYDGPSGI
jgi:hypothetical protein